MPEEMPQHAPMDHSGSPPPEPKTAAKVPVTTVHTLYRESAKNYRVLFGRPLSSQTLSREEGYTSTAVSFAPGARFALDLWARNAYGTIQWRCFVCEALRVGESGELVPYVAPAARVLLSTRGAAQSRLFLAWLKYLEEEGVDVLSCPAATFEAAHFRLQGSRADTTPPQYLSGRL